MAARFSLQEYGLSQADLRAIKRYMAFNAQDSENATFLAEDCAHALKHPEWLDEETHPIWDLAIEYKPVD